MTRVNSLREAAQNEQTFLQLNELLRLAEAQIKTLTAERDEYAAEARRQMQHVDTVLQERDALKSALEGLCNTGYSQPTNKAWAAAREALKG